MQVTKEKTKKKNKTKKKQEWLIVNLNNQDYWYVSSASLEGAIKECVKEYNVNGKNQELIVFPMSAAITKFLTVKEETRKTAVIHDQETFDE